MSSCVIGERLRQTSRKVSLDGRHQDVSKGVAKQVPIPQCGECGVQQAETRQRHNSRFQIVSLGDPR